eukprot:CAMPEP_0116130348 /NCGR_PEP_ID=MMETSP0329-20121206/8422_1 /TAXON_ID=697910 /ORGANISM="Pseudo-nitzschia arenysensis, Strain B593" /LENGTH=871 /DNA_ID=CAMNT_0003624701 /DNA_START=172 /DNA_END=2787 /DNA_ORIENTATION=-
MSAQVATSSGMSRPVDVGGAMTASAGSKSDNRIFPSASTDHIDGDVSRESKHHSPEEYQMRQISNDNDEGVEVVLEGSGKSSVIDSPPRHSQDQNVFRAPHPVRPRAIRGGHPSAVQHGSGSYGGYDGQPPPHSHSAPPHGHGDYRQHPYQPVPYAHSRSFDQQDGNVSSYPGAPPTSQYSPHVQYPPPGGRRPEDLNVISPNHKDHHASHHGAPRHNTNRPGGPPHHPPLTPRSTGSRYPPQTGSSSYHYPPASPVGRGAGNGASPPRVRGYGMRRPEGPYSAAQRSRDDANGSWGYPTPDRPRPPVVAESSFDSEHHYSSQVSHSSSHPTTPNAPHYGGPPHQGHYSDPSPPHYGSSGYHGSFDHGSSFDSHHAPYGPPTASPRHGGHYDHERPYYGHSPSSHPPPHQSEVSPYSYGNSPNGSYGGYYDSYSPHAPHYGHPPPRSYDEHDRYPHYPYHPHGQYHPHYTGKKDEKSGILLPKAASEVDFDISDPPLEPSTPASKEPVCESPADVNAYDVLCGRGGGTNSQVGNRRFRKLVQEFQPIYLLARRKEKPLLARTIVLVIRKRGGRFLKKDEETGELYEVGDAKAEAKTSQALREGLDVRATKSAASSLMDKKKKKSSKSQKDTSNAASEKKEEPEDETKVTSTSTPSETIVKSESQSTPDDSPQGEELNKDKAVVSPPGASDVSKDKETGDRSSTPTKDRAESPPSLPKLNEAASSSKGAANKPSEGTGPKAPPSPEQIQFRKRRRMRSADGAEPTTGTCGATNPFSGDKLFPDFCPPRADLGRAGSPAPRLSGDDVPHMDMLCGMTPVRTSSKFSDDDDIRYEEDSSSIPNAPGCAGIALDMMTGAAAGSFCLGPRVWSKRG